MSTLLYFAVALVFYLVIFIIYQVVSNPLRTVPGPLLARWTRLWEFYQVCQGRYEKTNIKLHKHYGKNATFLPCPAQVKMIYPQARSCAFPLLCTALMIQGLSVKSMVLGQPSPRLRSTTPLAIQTKSMQTCSQNWTIADMQSRGEGWPHYTQ
jgi:hypothetical protein